MAETGKNTIRGFPVIREAAGFFFRLSLHNIALLPERRILLYFFRTVYDKMKAREAIDMDMDTLGYFLFMDEQEKKQKVRQEQMMRDLFDDAGEDEEEE